MNKQNGLTLIEILIALLVLSIGLIGIAALHLVSLQNANSAYHSSLASSIALDFEERLWLRVGELGSANCIEKVDADLIASNLQTLWRGGPYSGSTDAHAVIPDVQIAAGELSAPVGVNSQAQVSLTISWNDSRFADNQNKFVHQARVPCYRPPAPPAEEEENGN